MRKRKNKDKHESGQNLKTMFFKCSNPCLFFSPKGLRPKFKVRQFGAGNMAWWVRLLSALPHNLSSLP